MILCSTVPYRALLSSRVVFGLKPTSQFIFLYLIFNTHHDTFPYFPFFSYHQTLWLWWYFFWLIKVSHYCISQDSNYSLPFNYNIHDTNKKSGAFLLFHNLSLFSSLSKYKNLCSNINSVKTETLFFFF